MPSSLVIREEGKIRQSHTTTSSFFSEWHCSSSSSSLLPSQKLEGYSVVWEGKTLLTIFLFLMSTWPSHSSYTNKEPVVHFTLDFDNNHVEIKKEWLMVLLDYNKDIRLCWFML